MLIYEPPLGTSVGQSKLSYIIAPPTDTAYCLPLVCHLKCMRAWSCNRVCLANSKQERKDKWHLVQGVKIIIVLLV